MKKITKLLPAMLALMLVSPAFASPSNNAKSEMNVQIKDFINITKTSEVATGTATVDDAYTTLTVTSMNANFKVINNLPDRPVYLVATVDLAGSGTAKALFGEDEQNMKLIFGNTTRKPTTEAIANLKGDAIAPAENANAFALVLTAEENFAPDDTSGAQVPTTVSLTDKNVKYVISNGIYNPKYTTGATVENSFSTHDTSGTYKATLTLTTQDI